MEMLPDRKPIDIYERTFQFALHDSWFINLQSEIHVYPAEVEEEKQSPACAGGSDG